MVSCFADTWSFLLVATNHPLRAFTHILQSLAGVLQSPKKSWRPGAPQMEHQRSLQWTGPSQIPQFHHSWGQSSTLTSFLWNEGSALNERAATVLIFGLYHLSTQSFQEQPTDMGTTTLQNSSGKGHFGFNQPDFLMKKTEIRNAVCHNSIEQGKS